MKAGAIGAIGFGGRVGAMALLAAGVAALGAASLPPLDRDESRFAQASAQMLESGDFLRIRFQDEARNKKPAAAYWSQAAAVAAFSDANARSIFFYRIPSILAFAAAVAAIAALGARVFGEQAGLIAGALALSTPVAAIEGMIAKADALLLAAVATALLLAFDIGARAAEGRAGARGRAALFWMTIGAAMLIKGPVALAFVAPPVIAIMLTLRDRRPRLYPLMGSAIVIAMVGPWLYSIQQATDGAFLRESLGADMLAKIGAAKEGHGAPPGVYLAIAPLTFLSLAALLPAALVGAWRDRSDWRVAALLAAIAAPWAAFELSATKLPHYLLPCLPALAALAARAATATGDARWRRAGAILALLAALILAGAVAYLARRYGGDRLLVMSALPLAAAATLFLAAARDVFAANAGRAGLFCAAGALALIVTATALVAPRLADLDVSRRLVDLVRREGLAEIPSDMPGDGPSSGPPIALAGYHEPSAVFLLGTRTMLVDAARAAALLADDGAAAIVEARALPDFRAALAARGCAPAEAARLSGLNYSNGRTVELVAFRGGCAARQ